MDDITKNLEWAMQRIFQPTVFDCELCKKPLDTTQPHAVIKGALPVHLKCADDHDRCEWGREFTNEHGRG